MILPECPHCHSSHNVRSVSVTQGEWECVGCSLTWFKEILHPQAVPPFTRFVASEQKFCTCCHDYVIQPGDPWYKDTHTRVGDFGVYCLSCARKLAPSRQKVHDRLAQG